jgi:hypothetical protein
MKPPYTRRQGRFLSFIHHYTTLLGRPVHLGFPQRLRPGTSPCPSDSILRYSLDGHPALQSIASSGSSSALAVSSFRLRARLDVCLPSAFSGQRGFIPACWIWRPSFERLRDFNPAEQRADQRALLSREPLSSSASCRFITAHCKRDFSPTKRRTRAVTLCKVAAPHCLGCSCRVDPLLAGEMSARGRRKSPMSLVA